MASNTIKGLTVEIGGDTTKLGKAIKDVEAQSRSLSKELGDINKLLKMDPGNTDLLAQKQKVLAEAVEATAKKLDTLKEAEKQVQAQFERGEVSEEQLRALQREIVVAENKMKGYQNAVKETTDAIKQLGGSGKNVSLSKTVSQQEAELKKLKQQYTDVVAAEGKKSASAKSLEADIKALSGELKTNKDRLSDAEKAADEAAGELDDLADAADKAEKSSGGLGGALANAAKTGLAAIGAAAGAAITGLTAAAESTREYRTEMGKLDTAFTQNGHSSEAAYSAYSELQGVLGETDQSVEAANHLAQLTDNEKDLSTWTGDILPGVFATFGASLPIEGLTEAANETAKVGQVTGPLADALNWAGVSEDKFNKSLEKCSSEQERQALITKTLAGLYGEASAAYKETNAEVIRANQANEQWTASLAEIGGAFEPVITDVKLMGASLLSDLVPGVVSVSEAFRGLLSGDVGSADALGSALSGIISQLLTKITDLLPSVASVAVSLVGTLASSIISALPSLVDTVAQVAVTVVSGLAELVPQLAASIGAAIPGIASSLSAALPELIAGIVSLVSAVASSIDQILPPLIAALPGLIMSVASAILENLPILLDCIIQLVMSLVGYAPDIISALLPLIPQLIMGVLSSLAENLPTILTALLELTVMLVTQVTPQIIAEVVKMIPQILVAIVTGLGQILSALVAWAAPLVTRIGTWLAGIGSRIGAWFSEVWTSFTTWLGQLISNIGAWAVDMATKAKEAGSNFLTNLVDFIKNLPERVGYFIGAVIGTVASFVVNMANKAREAGSKFLQNVVNFIKNLPSNIWTWLQNAYAKVTSWASSMATKAKDTGSKVVSNVVNFVKTLPSKIWTWLKNAVSKVTEFGTQAVSKAKTAAKNILDAVVNGIKGLPDKIKSVGKDVVRGLWNGINNMKDWVLGKIRSFGDGVLSGIKDFFKIKSPSRVFRDEVGAMLAEGMAVGIEDNADAPLDALTKVGDDLLSSADGFNGLTLERQINHKYSSTAAAAQVANGLNAKLDQILDAITRGQVILLDGKKLIGGTAEGYDAALGQRRALIEMGAL